MPNPLAAFASPQGQQSKPRSENPLAAFSTATAGHEAPPAPMTPEPQQERSALGYAGETLGNIPASAGRAIADLASALFSPIDTASAIGGAAAGGAQLLGDQMGVPDTGMFDDHRNKARAVGEFYSDRYGGADELADTIRTDPFGAMLDAGGLLTGGAGLAARAPGAAGRVARAVLNADPTGRAVNAAGRAIQNRLPKTPGNRAFIADAPTPDQLRGQGSALFEAAEQAGVKFKPDYYAKFADDLLSDLVDQGADVILSPKVSRVADLLEKSKGRAPSIQEMSILRRQFGNAAGSADAAERRLAGIAIDKIDDFVEGGAGHVGAQLAEARALWSRLRKSEVIDAAIENAQVAQAGVEAGLRNEFRSLWKARGSKRMRGFTEVELDAIKSVSEGNFGANVLRRIGSLGGGLDASRNMLNLMGGVAGGAAVGGPIGAALVPLAGHVAARASKTGTQNRAALARAITARGEVPKRSDVPRQKTALDRFLEEGMARRYRPGMAPAAAPFALGAERSQDPRYQGRR